MKFGVYWLILSSVVGSTACSKEQHKDHSGTTHHGLKADEAASVLVTVGDHSITAGDVSERLAEQSPYMRNQFRSIEKRREFLDNMVRFEILAMEAKRLGYDKAPEVQAQIRKAMVEALLEEEIDSKLKLDDISEQEVAQYYAAHPNEFNKEKQVRISHIVVADQNLAKQIQSKLQTTSLHERGELFAELVTEYSLDESSKANLGDIRFISKPVAGETYTGPVPAEVALAAFAIKNIGELSPSAVKSDNGFHIVMLTAKRDTLARSLDEVRRPIQNLLLRKRRKEMVSALLDKLRKNSSIERNTDLLDTIEVNDGKATSDAKR